MVHAKLKKIKLLLLDVDGVLTKGDIIYGDNGSQIKTFNVKDGLGIRLLINAGIDVGIVTGRLSKALLHRCKDLGIELIYDGVQKKGEVLELIISRTGLDPTQVAYVGDDLPGISLLKKAGVRIAVADAHETVKSIADLITVQNGGNGAVREVCELILKAKGLWKKIISNWD